MNKSEHDELKLMKEQMEKMKEEMRQQLQQQQQERIQQQEQQLQQQEQQLQKQKQLQEELHNAQILNQKLQNTKINNHEINERYDKQIENNIMGSQQTNQINKTSMNNFVYSQESESVEEQMQEQIKIKNARTTTTKAS